MDIEKTDLNFNSGRETDSAQTNDSVEIRKSENRVGEGPSYMRSRQIALKKFTPPEGECLKFPDRKLFLRRGSSVSSAHRINSESDPAPDLIFPQRLKSVRIIASAFFLEGCVPKSADRGTQTFDRLVPNPEGFGQSMFQNFSLGFECFLGRWWDRDVASIRKNLQNIPSA
jgi:hypothetical protein